MIDTTNHCPLCESYAREVERLTKALEFYGLDSTYVDTYDTSKPIGLRGGDSPIVMDWGDIAREALNKGENDA